MFASLSIWRIIKVKSKIVKVKIPIQTKITHKIRGVTRNEQYFGYY